VAIFAGISPAYATMLGALRKDPIREELEENLRILADNERQRQHLLRWIRSNNHVLSMEWFTESSSPDAVRRADDLRAAYRASNVGIKYQLNELQKIDHAYNERNRCLVKMIEDAKLDAEDARAMELLGRMAEDPPIKPPSESP
jgi:hypothetical protein